MSETNRPEVKSGVYSNTEISAAMAMGHILIDPFVEKNLNASSYDVTLGPYYWKTQEDNRVRVLNPYSEEVVQRYFGFAPKHAMTHKDWLDAHKDLNELEGIPLDQHIIVLRPGQRILAHTQEFIGIEPPGTTSMQARSSLGRLGITVCKDAGWGDPGYKNRWTMEIENNNEDVDFPLVVGQRIAQIIFMHTGEVEGTYSTDTGSYQAEFSSVEEMKTAWRPEDMLPRLRLDPVLGDENG